MELLFRPRFILLKRPLHTKCAWMTHLDVMKDIGFVSSYRKEVLWTRVLLHPMLKAATDCGFGAAGPSTKHISQRILLFRLHCGFWTLSCPLKEPFLRCFLLQIIEGREWSLFGKTWLIILFQSDDFLFGTSVDHLSKFLHLVVEKSIVKLFFFFSFLFQVS